MPGIYQREIKATRGEIRIPSLDVLVAKLDSPRLLRRREEATPELGSFVLHAAVSYFNQPLWDDSDYSKTITLWLGKKPFKVLFPEGASLVKEGQNLRVEGVEPDWSNL